MVIEDYLRQKMIMNFSEKGRKLIEKLSVDFYFPLSSQGGPCGMMAEVLDCKLEVSRFKLQSCYYVHFSMNTLWKSMNPLMLSAMG